MAVSTSSLALSGLASGFDWQTFVNTIMTTEQAPITSLQKEQSTNTTKVSALNTLGGKITSLQSSLNTLKDPNLYTGTTATSSNSSSSWKFTSSDSTPTGSYAINVSRLATATSLTGTSDIGGGISPIDDVSGVTLSSMTTAAAVTAGTFTINGNQVTIATTDSLNDVFTKISAATGGAVTAGYTAATDTMQLHSTSPIVLGASNDTSNFLAVMKLANNGTGTITSSSTLGTLKQSATLANSGLRNAITAVDGSGNGSFTINGVAINYNVNTDTLSSVINRINASSASVTASYDAQNDRMVLKNNNTGNLGINVSESAGGFLNAVGLAGGTTSYGVDAQYTVNNGPLLTSTSNTLDASSHGIPGLSVTVNSTTTETIAVGNDTSSMKSAIQSFITNYNAVQQYIDDQTKVTSSNGSVSTSLMSDNREIQNWSSTLRSQAFSTVSSASGTIQRLESLGIDFTGTGDQLSIKDSSKLDTALAQHPSDVASFFTSATTGFAARMSAFTSSVQGNGASTSGLLNAQINTLNKQNTDITTQIATIQRQLDAERAKLTAGFQAMESSESTIQQMQKTLANAFPTSSSA